MTAPHRAGHLDRGLHRIAWWESGNPEGLPVVIVHGGPGAGSKPAHRAPFDPERWRIIQFDQRGCGASTPQAELTDNATGFLLDDMELLRAELEVERWVVHGGSWGTTLGLLYGQRHPTRVLGFLLRAVFLCRDEDIHWTFERGGAELLRPDAFADFERAARASGGEPIVHAYARTLLGADRGPEQLAAARAWAEWEDVLCYLRPQPDGEPLSDTYVLELARLENHYLSQRGFLEQDQVLAGLAALQDVPAIIVHGRYDLCTPVAQAWALHQAWPASELRIVPAASHAPTEPPMAAALRQAAQDLHRVVSGTA